MQYDYSNSLIILKIITYVKAWCDSHQGHGVKVDLGNRGMTVEAAR